MIATLRYGRNGLRVELPDECVSHVLRQRPLPTLDDPAAATRAALAGPIGAAPLAEVARGRGDACIVVSDLTRPVPNAVILPPVLETLEDAGLPPERVTILVATGLHRPNTQAELREMLGDEVEIVVTNTITRDTGRMIFGRLPGRRAGDTTTTTRNRHRRN